MNRRRFLFGVLAAAAAGKRVAVAGPGALPPITGSYECYGRLHCDGAIGPWRRVTALQRGTELHRRLDAAWWRVGFTA